MDRNNTNFPILVTTRLKALYQDYKKAKESPADPEHVVSSLLHYYQYFPRFLLSTNIKGSRGMLAYLEPGTGKTRLAVAAANAIDTHRVIVLEPQGLHNNFRDNVHVWEEKTSEKRKYTFVTSNAYNTGDRFEELNLEDSFLIADEAHFLFKAIINSGEKTNARKIYDKIMSTKRIKILFLTGTPVSKHPFELVPCFNMLAGHELFPVNYTTFCQLYIKDNHMINREAFMNRIVGLVSHVAHGLPMSPESAINSAKPRDDHYYPEDLGTVVERVPMSEIQYQQYQIYRYKEDQEAKRATKGRRPPKALSLPSGSNMSTYYVHSRMCSDFLFPDAYLGSLVQDLPIECFTRDASPKLHLIASRIAECKGKTIAYSPFVERSLNPLGRYLELLGFEMYEHITAPTAPIADEPEVVGDGELRENTKKNSKTAYKYIEDIDELYAGDIEPDLIHGALNRTNAKRLIKFDKSTCVVDFDKNSNFFVDLAFDRNFIIKLVQAEHNIDDYRFYNNNKIPDDFKYGKSMPVNVNCEERADIISIIYLLTSTLKTHEDSAIVCGVFMDLTALFPNVKFVLECAEPDYLVGDDIKLIQKVRPKIAALSCNIELDGIIFMTPWSSKPRVISTNYELKTTDIDKYCEYHDVIRQWVTFDVVDHIDVKGFDRCFDCANEYKTWEEYISFSKSKMSVATAMKSVNGSLIVNNSLHGYLCDKPMCAKRERLYNMYKKGILKTDHHNEQHIKGGSDAPKYVILSGAVSQEDRARIKQIYNGADNLYGEKLKCILMSDVGATGLDLTETFETHDIKPSWSATIEKQFRFRAIRMGSHDRLPREERQVKSYIYLSTDPNAKEISIDEQFYTDSKAAEVLNDEFMSALVPVSFECPLFNYGNCHVCIANNTPLFSDNASVDAERPNACKPYVERELEASPIEHNGKTYYYVKDPQSLIGYKFYEYAKDYNTHVEFNGEEVYDMAEKIEGLQTQ